MVQDNKTVMMSFPLAILLSLLFGQSAFASGGVSTTAILAAVSEIPHKSIAVPVMAPQPSKKDQRLLIHDDVWIAKAKTLVLTR